MTKKQYEFLILINNQDCLKDIRTLRKKWGISIFNSDDAVWQWIQKIEKKANNGKLPEIAQQYPLFERDCAAIVGKYQESNKNNKQFVGLFAHFVLREQILFMQQKAIKNSFVSNLRYMLDYNEEQVCVLIKKGATKQDYINNWENVKSMLTALPENDISTNKRNKQKHFETKLRIYKYYRRAKKHWKNPKDIFARLYLTDTIDSLLRQLGKNKFHSQDALRKIITLFEKEYGHLQIISESELNAPFDD